MADLWWEISKGNSFQPSPSEPKTRSHHVWGLRWFRGSIGQCAREYMLMTGAGTPGSYMLGDGCSLQLEV